MATRCPTRLAAAMACAMVVASLACAEETVVYSGPAFTRDPPPVGPLAGRIVATNNGDDTLSAVAADGSGPVARIPVGLSPVELEGPHHLAVDPKGRFLYVNLSLAVAGSGSGPHGAHGAGDLPGLVVKLDARDGREVGRAQVDPNPGDSAITADGKTLFVTHYDLIRWARGSDSNLVAIDTEKMVVRRTVPLCPAAHGVRLAADGQTLYASCGPDALAVVDLREPQWPVRVVPLPGGMGQQTCRRCPFAVAVAPDGTVWVSSLGATGARGGIDVFGPDANGGGAFDPARSVSLQGSALFAAFSTTTGGGFRVYVPEQGPAGDFVRIYEPGGSGRAPTEIGTIVLTGKDCTRAHMLLVSGDPVRGHLVCEGDHLGPGSLVWLDLASETVMGSVPLGVFPDGLALVPDLEETP